MAKGPPVGISPSNLLKDKFKCVRCTSVIKDLGITPDRLLRDISNNSKLMALSNDCGIGPCNLLCQGEINNILEVSHTARDITC